MSSKQILTGLANLWAGTGLLQEHKSAFLRADPSIIGPLASSLEAEPTWAKVTAVGLLLGAEIPDDGTPLDEVAATLVQLIDDSSGGRGAQADPDRRAAVVLGQRIGNLLGTRIAAHLATVTRMALLFEDAAREADAVLTEVDELNAALDAIQDRSSYASGAFMRRLNLRIYTCAAAAVSLRDYTLRMLEATDGVEQRSVTAALDALHTGPRSWFIRNLRNVIVHHRDLPVSPFVKFGGPTVRGAVFLNRDQLRPLRTEKEWGRAAELLDGADDLIDLKETLDEHTAEALAAVRELTVSVEQAYSDELNAALRLQDELTVIHQRIARRSVKS